jgi:ER lumen protein retaining receptor
MVSLNVFRTSADFIHLVAILILLWRIRLTKTCAGVSLKTQELYLLVFVTRYLDLAWNFESAYNTVMKLFFLGATGATVFLMRFKYAHTYDREHDTFRVVFLIGPCLVAALCVHSAFTVAEILWTFSIYLEAVAILPQLFLVQRTGEVEAMNSHYIFCLGSYRALYILNWVYRRVFARRLRSAAHSHAAPPPGTLPSPTTRSGSCGCRASCRPCCTATSSTITSRRASRARS